MSDLLEGWAYDLDMKLMESILLSTPTSKRLVKERTLIAGAGITIPTIPAGNSPPVRGIMQLPIATGGQQ